jgi:hypothetical protein
MAVEILTQRHLSPRHDQDPTALILAAIDYGDDIPDVAEIGE